MEKSENQKYSITLTSGEWEIIYTYLNCGIDSIKNYISEKGSDVSEKFWLERIDKIKEIMKKIQERA